MGLLEQQLIDKVYSDYGLHISSRRQILRFVKEANNFRLPLSESLKYFLVNTEEFYAYILERTDLPIIKSIPLKKLPKHKRNIIR